MATIKIPDNGGDTLVAYDTGKYRLCTYSLPLEHIVRVHEQLPNFRFRDGDILIASYAKTGCTWLHELIGMLLLGGRSGDIPNKLYSMLETTPQEKLDAMPSPRLLNSHAPYGRLPASVHSKKVKVVLVVRNPKDAAVSLYNMMRNMKLFEYEGKFENWLPLYIHGKMMYEPYYKYIRDWEAAYESKALDILLVHYEEMKEDTTREIKRLAEFLDIPLEEGTLSRVAEQCQFDVMRNRFEKDMYGNIAFKAGTSGFFRKGVVGDWKNWFTVAQSEYMDEVFEEKMMGSKIKFRYVL